MSNEGIYSKGVYKVETLNYKPSRYKKYLGKVFIKHLAKDIEANGYGYIRAKSTLYDLLKYDKELEAIEIEKGWEPKERLKYIYSHKERLFIVYRDERAVKRFLEDE